ncbi:helix-turn-helix domain-containing protein [Yokenella regensburgei]|uniref:helix-turn-helix domain-containing protein n=1 Tax=Yokenella regensburgei TaxID=158877 RepID=UPI003EDA512B
MNEKENEFAIPSNGKESLPARLRQLIGDRSARAAAAAWGLSFSTLNNYLNRGTDPSFSVMQAIAAKEQVSLDWLAFGNNDLYLSQKCTSSQQTLSAHEQSGEDSEKEHLRMAWLTAFEFMGQAEARALLKIIINGGARGLIKLAEHETNVEEAFMLLSPELKERAVNLINAHVEAKKGASQNGDIDSTVGPSTDVKQAG